MPRDPFFDLTGGQRVVKRQSDIDSAPAGTDQRQYSLATLSTSMWFVFMLMFVVMVFLFGRLLQLQVFTGSTYRLRSEGNRIRTLTTPAPRGTILDRQGRALAQNVPDIAFTIVPADLPKDAEERASILSKISGIIAIPRAELESRLADQQRSSTEPVTIIDHVPYTKALSFIVATADLTAVNIIAVPNRSYPNGLATANIIGYTGRISPQELQGRPAASQLDVVGKNGLEKTYNEVLTGRDGTKQVERDVRNREQRVISQQDPVPGRSIVTSLDLDLQQLLSTELNSAVKRLRSPGGAAVALDPKTGEVLAIVNAPTYDNNWFVTSDHQADIQRVLNDPQTPQLNRAIAGEYPSGSIIKPMIAAAALSEQVITPNTTVNSVGGFAVGNDFFPDWQSGGHGVTNVTKAIADSVNTFFYAVGGGYEKIVGLGVDRIVAYLQKFGWGSALGIDLPSERSGLLPTKEWRTTKRASPWKLGDTYHLSIGQGDLVVTPLQVASAIASVANGGTLYQPHLVTQIQNADGSIAEEIKPKPLAERIVPLRALATVQAGMREGVLNGSSRSLQSLPVSSAGKTGTAQFGREGKTHAWFAAYAPYEKPEIVIAVVVEAGGEGHAAALPVAKTALQWYFTTGPGAKK